MTERFKLLGIRLENESKVIYKVQVTYWLRKPSTDEYVVDKEDCEVCGKIWRKLSDFKEVQQVSALYDFLQAQRKKRDDGYIM